MVFVIVIIISYIIQYCWRWTGYSYGIDILVNYTHCFNQRSFNTVEVSTMHLNTNFRGVLSLHNFNVPVHKIICSLKLVSQK